MIRFVDLRPAEIVCVRFAFWDTIRDRFVEGSTGQGWETWQEFLEDMPPNLPENTRARFRGLVPSWVDEELSS